MSSVVRCLSILLVAAPVSAAAQRAADVAVNDRDRAGPYAFVGGGGVGVSESCVSCGDLSGRGIGLRAGFGWAIVPRVSVEGTIEGTQRSDDRMWERTVHALVGVRIRVTRQVAIRLGAGPVAVRQEVPTATSTYVMTDDGPGWMAGIEYSIPLRPQISMDPYAELRGSGRRDLKWKGQVVSQEHTVRVLDIGVAVRWHLRSLMLPRPRRPQPD